MKTFIILAVFATVVVCQEMVGNGTDSNSTTVLPSSTTIVSSTTVPSEPTNSTVPSNSTTPALSTTPEPANTTVPSNNTTPMPSTTPKTTPTPPTPVPDVDTVNVTVKNGTGFVCIAMTAQMSLIVTDGNSTQYVIVPQNATSNGNCSLNATTQSVDITFNTDWKLQFIFSKDDNDDVTISEIDITYGASLAAEATKTDSVKGNFFKSGSDGDYYLCNSNTTIAGMKDVTLTATNLRYKAFNEDKDAGYSKTATECAADEDTSSVVPIAVGAALAGLVIIVLIAYLIGRRRSRQTGYESV